MVIEIIISQIDLKTASLNISSPMSERINAQYKPTQVIISSFHSISHNKLKMVEMLLRPSLTSLKMTPKLKVSI